MTRERNHMPETVFGLPTHAIVVHATVVLLPLAALLVLLHAFWPAARRRLGFVTPLLALAALVLTPLSTESGEVLERSVGRSPLVSRHEELADGLLPWTIGLFVVAVGLWLLDRRRARVLARSGSGSGSGPGSGRSDLPAVPRLYTLVAALLALAVTVGAVQQVVRAGHAGARATWEGVVPTSDGG